MSLLQRITSRVRRVCDKVAPPEEARRKARFIDTTGLTRIQYASAEKLLPGWLNVDLADEAVVHSVAQVDAVYRQVNLTQPHPFCDNTFEYGYSEDFLEHLEQDEAILFLCEAYRTFRPGGALRLSTPSLEGVLRRHYRGSDFGAAAVGQHEAYRMWGHLHFFCRDEMRLIAQHIGFSSVVFFEHGQSQCEALRGLDTREHQRDLNLYVELTK